jgi:hypothetical protein
MRQEERGGGGLKQNSRGGGIGRKRGLLASEIRDLIRLEEMLFSFVLAQAFLIGLASEDQVVLVFETCSNEER